MSNFTGATDRAAGQKSKREDNIYSINSYIAFLSKADSYKENGKLYYDILFELILKEQYDTIGIVVSNEEEEADYPQGRRFDLQSIQISYFEMIKIAGEDIEKSFGFDFTSGGTIQEYFAEGSYFLFDLKSPANPNDPFYGTRYWSKDTKEIRPAYYTESKTFNIEPDSIKFIMYPQYVPPSSDADKDPDVFGTTYINPKKVYGYGVDPKSNLRKNFINAALNNFTLQAISNNPAAHALVDSAQQVMTPIPVAIASAQVCFIGIMDVGQGDCALLFDQQMNPLLYFDVGYPLNFCKISAPATLNASPPSPLGPIKAWGTIPIPIVLSHTDYDHWSLGINWGMHLTNTWYLRASINVGPAWAKMAPSVVNKVIITHANVLGLNGYGVTVYTSDPPTGSLTPNLIINNTGLAMRVDIPVPAAILPTPTPPTAYGMLMPGDANFPNIAVGAVPGNLFAVRAVHHGSQNNGAIPLPNYLNPDPGINSVLGGGYIAYSYGVNRSSGDHAYHFPHNNAVNAYNGLKWGNVAPPGTSHQAQSTAEGPNIHPGDGVTTPIGDPRGNIFVGDVSQLPTAPVNIQKQIKDGTSLGTNYAAFDKYPNKLLP